MAKLRVQLNMSNLLNIYVMEEGLECLRCVRRLPEAATPGDYSFHVESCVLELGTELHSRSVYILPPHLIAVCYAIV